MLINPFDSDFVGLKMGKQKADVVLIRMKVKDMEM